MGTRSGSCKSLPPQPLEYSSGARRQACCAKADALMRAESLVRAPSTGGLICFFILTPALLRVQKVVPGCKGGAASEEAEWTC